MSDTSVEQLWYAWSDGGIDPIKLGFRIRAASDGLHDYKSERVRNLDCYLRYSLPRGANPTTPPEKAPVCLAFIDTGQERILVHKVYAGKDAFGRYGVFFVHLLAGLPPEFSVQDAISLWQSLFWRHFDPPPSEKERRDTYLDTVSLTKLNGWRRDIRRDIPIAHDLFTMIEKKYLPYIIRAYLTRKPPVEKKNDRSQPLYIAAPGNVIALLIAGLTRSLPPQLTKNLTFSTYEHDLSAATTEIVGTGWLSDWETTRDKHVEQLLPRSYYEEKLALNYYTGDYTFFEKLEAKQLVEHMPLAADFASFAAHCFLYGETADFQDLLDTASNYPDLDVDKFLKLYDALVKQAQNPSQENVEDALDSADPNYAAKMLSKYGFQKKIVDLTMYKQKWWSSFALARFSNLRKESARVPALAQALYALASYALPKAQSIVRGQRSLLGASSGDRETDNAYAILAIIDQMTLCIAPPTNEKTEQLWRSIVNILGELDGDGASNIKMHALFNWLSASQLSAWFDSPPAGERNLAQVLTAADLNVAEIGLFFQSYGQKYVTLYPDSATLLDLLHKYTTNRGQLSMFILRLWLDLRLHPNTLEQVLRKADLMPDDIVWFLIHYSDDYIVYYSQSQVLPSYLVKFLEYLCITDLNIFKSNDLVRGPSDTEKLLGVLAKLSLPLNLHELLDSWYTVATFVRKPALLQQKPQEVASSIRNLLGLPKLQQPTHTLLLQMLVQACLANEQQLVSSINVLQIHLLSPDLQQILEAIAIDVQDGVRQKRYAKTLLEKCILFALHPNAAFSGGIEQQYKFLDILLYNLDEKTYRWLEARTKRWSRQDNTAWQRYKTQHLLPAPVSLSRREQSLLQRERRTAFDQMQKNLRSGSSEQIIRVDMDYLATLDAYPQELPMEWRREVDRAVAIHNRQKIEEEWRYVYDHEKIMNWQLSQSKATGAKPSPAERIKWWWERTLVFMFMWLALHRQGAGRIARIMLDYVIIFETYEDKVPAQWWPAINAALDFFIACDEADEHNDLAKEQAIINASQQIDHFRSLGYPVPRLTMHEKQRSQQARQVTRQYLPGIRHTGG